MTQELAIPMTIVSQETSDLIQAICQEAKAFKVTSPEDAKKGSEYLNQVGRMITAVKDAVTERRRPFKEAADVVSAKGEVLLSALTPVKVYLSGELGAFDKIQRAEQAKAAAERQRLADEARRNQEAAAKAVESAKDEASFKEAAKAFDEGLAKVEEAKAVYVPPVIKMTGAKVQRTPVIESVDLSKLPLTYHMADESKIKKAILAGIIEIDTPGIKWRIDENFVGTGR